MNWAIQEKGCSQRRACGLIGLAPKTYRYASRRSDDAKLRARLKVLASERRRFGYRRLHILLKREGATIVQVELPDQRQLTAACQFVLAVEAAAFHKRWMIERPQDYGAQVFMRLQNGLAFSGVSYLEAMRWRGPALAAHNAAVAGVDAMIMPVAPVAAPTIADSDVGNSPDAEAMIQRLTRFTRPINYLGLPSLSIPTGFTKGGLPVGMQLVGRSFDEAMLIRIGAAFQRATDFHQRIPKLA